MDTIFYGKVCMVITILFIGLNVRQLISSYSYIRERLQKVRKLIETQTNGSLPDWNWVSLTMYIIIPGVYLWLLHKANFSLWGFGFLGIKFVLSAYVGIKTQRSALSKSGYTKIDHYKNQIDNVLNIILYMYVVYWLLFSL